MNLHSNTLLKRLSFFLTICSLTLVSSISYLNASADEDFDSDHLVIAERLNGIYKPMVTLDINQIVISYLKGYLERRPQHTASLIGRAEIIFPKFDQWLAEEGVPGQIKYLSVLESALNPRGLSRAGAYGPWQFMPATGKIFHLNQTTFIDERADFEKSTRAAAAYLKQLFGMYDDWRLAFCAYNAGPGRVNRAIRMAKTNRFDQVIRFLPRETQNYVPAFIAAMYVMNFYEIHGIEPNYMPQELTRTHEVRVFDYTPFDMLAEATGVELEYLQFLNPSYIRDAIPANPEGYTILLPEANLPAFYNFRPHAISEASFQALKKQDIVYRPAVSVDNPEMEYENKVENVRKTYTVKRGENLSIIARKTGVSVAQLRSWNNIRGNIIHPNQRLSYYKRETIRVPVFKEPEPESILVEVNDSPGNFHDLPDFQQIHQKVSGGKLVYNAAKQHAIYSITEITRPNLVCLPSRSNPGELDVCSVWGAYHLANGKQTIGEIAQSSNCCEIALMQMNKLPRLNEIPKAGSFVKLPIR